MVGNDVRVVARWSFIIALLAATTCPSQAASRFFFSGDGTIDLRRGYSPERIAVRYRDRAGRYDPSALTQIQHFLRSHTDDQIGDVSLRLIELIDFIEDRYNPSKIVLLSGYRSPTYNRLLRQRGTGVARASLHTEGLAADLQFVGVEPRQLWLDLRELQVGGVGLYEQHGSLHIDTGRARFWQPATSRVDDNLSADNARLFARTDFDRYAVLDGALVRLHRPTALPVRVGQHAQLGQNTLELVPVAEDVRLIDGCYVIDQPADRYEFRIVNTTDPPPEGQPLPLRLTTCTPRVGATPAYVESNAVERCPECQ